VVTELTPDDADWAADLMAERRRQYCAHRKTTPSAAITASPGTTPAAKTTLAARIRGHDDPGAQAAR
jgi:hypothetical protein